MTRLHHFLLLLLTLAMAAGLHAQKRDSRIAPTLVPLERVEHLVLPRLDNDALRGAELADRAPGRAPRFAENRSVDISPSTHGLWEELPDGRAVWRLGLSSPGAFSLNLGFTRYRMPEGGVLLLYAPDQRRVLGPFTPSDNEEHAQLWTPILDGDEVVVEVQVPRRRRAELELQLSFVNHDFLGFSRVLSAACHLDVACGAADGWPLVDQYRDIIRSVATYSLGGNRFCTGFLINNSRNDCTPYFLTAYHCEVFANDAPSLVVFWNYENSTCRQPGSPASGQAGDGALTTFNAGAVLRAAWSTSDFSLLELDDPVNPNAHAFFAGWNAAAPAPQDTLISIHHPDNDEKRISFAFTDAFPANWPNENPAPDGNHLVVPQWSVGSTEGGSSGAPLFDRQRRVVGQLHGGLASCNNSLFDSFGRLHTSWAGGGTPETRLRDWLDPTATGLTILDGREQTGCAFAVTVTPSVISLCAGEADTLKLVASEAFPAAVSLQLSGLPPGASGEFLENPLAPGDTTLLILQTSAGAPGGEFVLTLSASDGLNMANTSLSLRLFAGVPGGVELLSPPPGDEMVALSPVLRWQSQASTTSYELELGFDLNDPFLSAISPDTVLFLTGLLPDTLYQWRVRGRNACGAGPWSEVFTFFTAAISCRTGASAMVPVTIPTTPATVTSTLVIDDPGTVFSMEVRGLDITHSWVGDLKVSLVSPAGTEVVLFDRPGLPASPFGCDGANLLLDFSDEALQEHAVLENTCGNNPAIAGTFRPLQPLAVFAGEPVAGTWTLRITDFADEDGGRLNAWQLAWCALPPSLVTITPEASSFDACLGDTLRFEVVLGVGFAGPEVELAAGDPPPGANIAFNPNPAVPGDTVQVTVGNLPEPGSFDLFLKASDGMDVAETAVTVQVIAVPAAPLVLSPADGASISEASPLLQWSLVSQADSFRVELARDAGFNEVVNSAITTVASFTAGPLPAGGEYFWRVTAINACGEAGSEVRSFIFRPNAARELAGQRYSVFPNPAREVVYLTLEQPLSEPLLLNWYTAAGRFLSGTVLPAGQISLVFPIADRPAGIYFLHLQTSRQTRVERIVK